MSRKKDSGEYKSLLIDDAKYKTIITAKFEKRVPYKTPDESKITSIIPGTIVKITVEEGDKLMILEAMKMRNQLLVPFDGKILKIHVQEGQIIPKSTLLVEIELMQVPADHKKKPTEEED